MRHISALTFFLLLALATAAQAAVEDVGTLVALRGQATILRGAGALPAKVRSAIQLRDSVTTGEASRAKFLFIDESVLTLSEKSKLVVSEFVHSKARKGKSTFNLLEGKMRAVVGKTEFEVQTPTAVAAARGTVILFEVGTRGGRQYTTITCLEGIVEIRSSLPGVMGTTNLKPGMTITVSAGDAPGQPTTLTPADTDKAKKESKGQGGDKAAEAKSQLTGSGPGSLSMPLPTTPIQQQPVTKQPTTVKINIDVSGK